MGLLEVVKALKDVPLKVEDAYYFVDRKEELDELIRAATLYEGEIIGVCGERGIGKTTLFNFLELKSKFKVLVNIINRENKLTILTDVLYALYKFSQKVGDKEAEVAISQLLEELGRASSTLSFGLSTIVSISYAETRGGVSYSNIVEKLKRIVDLLSRHNFYVILDEIDKEDEREILLVLDVLKDAFVSNNATLIVALPYSFYSIYLESQRSGKAKYNLENVFSYILKVDRMADEDIEELILRRVDRSFFGDGSLDLILLYAAGNPRRAITAVKESALLALKNRRDVILKEDVRVVIRKYYTPLVQQLSLTEKEREVLKVLQEGFERAKEVIGRPLLYKYLKHLRAKGLVEGKGKGAHLTRTARLLLEAGLV